MNFLGQKISLRRILGMIAGVVVIGVGIAVFKFSHLGNDSISALNLRIAELSGLPFSIENVLMNLCLFVPQLIWGRRYIGLGTIINSFCIGFIVTFTSDVMTAAFGTADTLPVQLFWVAVGVLVVAFGCSLYQTADLGVAPYDALLLRRAVLQNLLREVLCEKLDERPKAEGTNQGAQTDQAAQREGNDRAQRISEDTAAEVGDRQPVCQHQRERVIGCNA